jgi:DNA-binding MarR family transcriptional regulator
MAYNLETTLKSEQAYQVLRFINSKEEGSYSTEISKELDFDRSVVSDMLSQLEELGIIKEAKRTKAKYYVISDDLEKPIQHLWERFVMEDDHHISEKIDKYFQEQDEKLSEIFNGYVVKYLSNYETSTIRKMLIADLDDSFYYATIEVMGSDNTSEHWIIDLADLMHTAYQIQHLNGKEEMKQVLESLELRN